MRAIFFFNTAAGFLKFAILQLRQATVVLFVATYGFDFHRNLQVKD
jgi:hypothetical protein